MFTPKLFANHVFLCIPSKLKSFPFPLFKYYINSFILFVYSGKMTGWNPIRYIIICRVVKQITALFKNTRTLKFKSRRHNYVFHCRQSELRSQASKLETQKHTKPIEIPQSQITNHDFLNPLKLRFCFLWGPLRWFTAAKNANVGCLLNFRIRVFMKSVVT